MPITGKTTIVLKWNGKQKFRSIKDELRRNLSIAVKLVRTRIRRDISIWGSKGLKGGRARLRQRHSKPGGPPFRQTGNLYNSIKQRTKLKGGLIIGEIWTDVKYAKTLEKGGLDFGGGRKKHTRRFVVNPLGLKIRRIAKRPFFLKNFIRSRRSIVTILAGKGGIVR